jgi:hypothetical protein
MHTQIPGTPLGAGTLCVHSCAASQMAIWGNHARRSQVCSRFPDGCLRQLHRQPHVHFSQSVPLCSIWKTLWTDHVVTGNATMNEPPSVQHHFCHSLGIGNSQVMACCLTLGKLQRTCG